MTCRFLTVRTWFLMFRFRKKSVTELEIYLMSTRSSMGHCLHHLLLGQTAALPRATSPFASARLQPRLRLLNAPSLTSNHAGCFLRQRDPPSVFHASAELLSHASNDAGALYPNITNMIIGTSKVSDSTFGSLGHRTCADMCMVSPRKKLVFRSHCFWT